MFNLNRFVTVDLKVTQLVGCDLFFGSFKSSYESRMSFFLLGRRFCMDIFNLIYSYVNTKKFINLVTGLLTKRALV